jgi:hypothetical protein
MVVVPVFAFCKSRKIEIQIQKNGKRKIKANKKIKSDGN